jgi:hypothetical protein
MWRTDTKARLHPKWVGGRDGYRYSVIHDGKLLVDRSREPECDAARALLAQGITGKLTMLDGKTGIPRTVVDIEKAAKLRTVDESVKGLRFKPYREMGSGEGYSPETLADGASEPPSKSVAKLTA